MTTTSLRRPRGVAGLLAVVVVLLAWLGSGEEGGHGTAPLPACFGPAAPLRVSSQMPYARASVGGAGGDFVLDFGADLSSITPGAFATPASPRPLPGTHDQYADFQFFGAWGTVRLLPQPEVAVQGSIRQAGVIGTDFLSRHVYTLDYWWGRVHRAANGEFCSPGELVRAGFRAIDTQGYYSARPATLNCPAAGGAGRCPNIPTLPIRIGTVRSVAQLDTGFDDGCAPHSVNINGALFDALQRAEVALAPRPDLAPQLTTCQASVSERVDAYQLAPGSDFALVGEGGAERRYPAREVFLFVKRTPPQAAACGGIGTWQQPAAQLGASFFARSALVVDPFAAKVWLRDDF